MGFEMTTRVFDRNGCYHQNIAYWGSQDQSSVRLWFCVWYKIELVVQLL